MFCAVMINHRSDAYRDLSQGRCPSGKVFFASEQQARVRAQQLMMRAYSCHFCNGWHLSSRKQLHRAPRIPKLPPRGAVQRVWEL